MGDSKSKGVAALVIVAGVCLFCAVVAIVSDRYLPPDNEVEQIAEKVIKEESGIDVDFTPEKK